MECVFEKVYSVQAIDGVADELRQLLVRCRVMTFQGTLGAGKTTLIKALLRKCGVSEIVTSPTFTYVNCYKNNNDESFYHFDCYRLATVQAFLDAGFDEYLYVPHSWAFIEWPEVIEPLLKTGVCRVFLDYEGPESRHIKILLS
jgi:tRNA threonylcarbamoyladenosine biosynthesis protein TsaE